MLHCTAADGEGELERVESVASTRQCARPGSRVPAEQPQSASLPLAGESGDVMVSVHVAHGMLVLHLWLAGGSRA